MNKKIRSIQLLLAVCAIFSTNVFAAQWQLDSNNSRLSFISIKKSNIAEIHQFKKLQGQLDPQGQLTVVIDLASVDTNIAVRDQRMKEFFFEVDTFSTATITATIDDEILDSIAEGASTLVTVDAILDLHGQTKSLAIDVIITRLVSAKLSVVSAQPIVLNIADFSLVAGVEKLMELAKLPSISHAIPVSFYLTFNLKNN